MADEKPDYTKVSYWTSVAAPQGTWSEAVEVIAQKLDVAVKFNQDFTFNTIGAENVAKLLRYMGERLDFAVDHYASPSEIRAMNLRFKELQKTVEGLKQQVMEFTAQSVENLDVPIETMSSPIPDALDETARPVEYKRKWWQLWKRHP